MSNRNYGRFSLPYLLSFIISPFFYIPAFAQLQTELNSDWKCARASTINTGGEKISDPKYSTANWMNATVPGTVLTTLLNNKLVPDPFYGMNNELIPDIYQTGADHYTYWFVKDFQQKPGSSGDLSWLHFRGVNYGYDVYLNGHKLNASTHYGMFLRSVYNITPFLSPNGKNRIAVIVYPPDPVGNANGGQGGDGTIAKNVTHQYVAGWDWIQPIRDRNTGIWDKVFIERTNKVNLKHPQVITLVPGKREPGMPQDPAVLKVSAEIENPGNEPVKGILQYMINGEKVSRKIELAAKQTTNVILPDHTVQHPELWWPNGYGPQHLYNIKLRFVDEGSRTMDEEKVEFGIREIQTSWNEHTKSREIAVNGQKIFIRGGNWIISDAMLRLSKERYDAEIRFHRDMNLNLIRIWGGALTERPEFYQACDKYGMLVFQDFWFSGDCNGRWKDPMKKEDQATRRKYPDDHSLVLESLVDQVKMIRNHASLALYCGGNEITPPEDILHAIKDSILPTYDDTRYFFDYSNSDSMSLNTLGGNGDGPYGIQPIDTFWAHSTWPFNSEIGSVGVGDYASLERFLPEQNLEQFPTKDRLDPVWKYHKYIGYNEHIARYGEPQNVMEFADKAQLVNYDQYRALIEGFSSHMWDWYTGVIIWKTQNPWTALRGQMYDYYLDPNACLYGLKKAGEAVHTMYDPVRGKIMIVNNSFNALDSMQLQFSMLDFSGKTIAREKMPVSVKATSVEDLAAVKEKVEAAAKERGIFLSLKLFNHHNELLSENLYWLADEKGHHSGLQQMSKVEPVVEARKIDKNRIAVTIRNPANGPVAFFNRISLVNEGSHKRVLPVFYSDNYVSVLPGETKTTILEYTGDQSMKRLLVNIKGWNVEEKFIKAK